MSPVPEKREVTESRSFDIVNGVGEINQPTESFLLFSLESEVFSFQRSCTIVAEVWEDPGGEIGALRGIEEARFR